MSNTPLAGIFGCSDLQLSADERAFYREANPLGLILFKRNCANPAQVKALVEDFRQAVGRADAPVLIDEEGGKVQRLTPPAWQPHPAARELGLLAERDLAAGERAAYLNAQLIGLSLMELGINVDAAPVLDTLVAGANEVIGSRAFSADPAIVAALGRAACEGFISVGVLPIIKHMPGHGRANADSHIERPTVTTALAELWQSDFAPFKALADMPWAMTAHVVYSALDAQWPGTHSSKVLQELIRGEMGFDGVLISDCIHMNALYGSHPERAQQALVAGVDLVLNSHGSVAEMEAVAKVLPPLAGEASRRVQASLQRIANSQALALDKQALSEERASLLG
ncbi:beta-N-acetylhexosaminidase [Balneatrix alpica]|uniref:beta-N-acetylhexosaminidase n=1 Tax=Balneatrix alpica TaxID=75684 RepID=A0ABV5ZEK2_9GAMM|nr:beta-N-acetylhexosaminidase [Balneatrix alpica]